MKITCDPAKRALALKERGLDFFDAVHVFAGDTVEFEDMRQDYGEKRIICYGLLNGHKIVVGYVQRGSTRHIFSMRNCHEKEWKKIWL